MDTGKASDVQIGGDHYKSMKIQPMEYSLANQMDAGQHTAIKYISRFKTKNGLEDLKKAKHTIDLLIDHYYPDEEPIPVECPGNLESVEELRVTLDDIDLPALVTGKVYGPLPMHLRPGSVIPPAPPYIHTMTGVEGP